MTNEPRNGDLDVPDEQQQDAAALESPASSASAETPETDFDIDLGSYSASREDDVDINLDFGSLPTTEEEPEAVEPEEESDAGNDALEAFRSDLRAKPGDWYVVHTYSGLENRVLQNLEKRVSSLNMLDYIYEIT